MARISELEFVATMKRALSPSQPIQSPEFLKGRDNQLDEIRRSLFLDGKQVFIYGYRGVGKTSLAQTAAFQYQSPDGIPIMVGCTEGADFLQLIQDLFRKAFAQDPRLVKKKLEAGIGLKFGINAELKASIEQGTPPKPASFNEALALVQFVAECHSQKPVVIIDEFDQVKRHEDQALFANLVKQLGDQGINMRLIFCGIADSIDAFFASHGSTYRYFHTVKLDRLELDPRLDIIRSASKALDIDVDSNTATRIARISDGFPHFIHLVCEKMFWLVYDDKKSNWRASADHYEKAVIKAVSEVGPYLKVPYEKATKKYTNDYEPILWAMADNHELHRRSTDVYNSYLRIMQTLGVEPLSRDHFNTRMNNLKKPAYGSVFVGTRAGWYEYHEKMLRGYARMRAEEKGVELESESPLQARKFRHHGQRMSI